MHYSNFKEPYGTFRNLTEPFNTMDAVRAYLERIKNVPVLSAEEERVFLKKAQDGDDQAKNHLVVSNLKLVVTIAKHYINMGLPFMDLIAEGNMGLLKAIDKFDLSKEFRFSTYGTWWIKQAITRALIDQGKTIRIPVYMSELISKYKKAQEEFRQKFHCEPSREDIAKKMRVTQKKVGDIEMWMRKKTSLETPVGDEGGSEVGDFIRSTADTDTEEVVSDVFEKEEIDKMLQLVDSRAKAILDMRFGLIDGNTYTLAEVAEKLNLSRERVRQIEEESLARIREYLKEQEKNELF